MKRFFLLSSIFYIVLGLNIALPQTGQRLYRYFPEAETGGFGSIWSIIQDDRGIMYFGNNRGILEYDGVNWKKIPVNNHSYVRSLAKDLEGKIYVGAQGEVGYLSPNGNGVMLYTNLTQKLNPKDRGFTDVWSTHISENVVYFHTTNAILILKNGEFTVINTSFSYHRSFMIDSVLYLRTNEKGFCYLENNTLLTVEGSEIFKKEYISAMFAINDYQIIIGSRTKGLFVYDTKTKTLNNDEIPKSTNTQLKKYQIYHGLKLNRQQYLFNSSGENGAFVLDKQFNIINMVNKAHGFIFEVVYFSMLDVNNNVWMGLPNGIVRMDIFNPVSHFNYEHHNILGGLKSIARFKNKLYVCTLKGIYYSEAGKFQLLPNSQIQPISLLNFEVPNSNDEKLLVASVNDGVYELIDNKPRHIINESRALKIVQSNYNPEVLYIGLQGGICAYRYKNDTWTKLFQVSNLSQMILYLEEDKLGNLWASLGIANGLVNIKNASKGIEKDLLVNKHDSLMAFPVVIEDSLVFVTTSDWFAYDHGNEKIVNTNFLNELRSHDGTYFSPMQSYTYGSDSLIIAQYNGDYLLYKLAIKGEDTYQLQDYYFNSLPKMGAGVDLAYIDHNKSIWITGASGLYKIEHTQLAADTTSYNTSIRLVTTKEDSVIFGGTNFYRNNTDNQNRISLSPVVNHNTTLPYIKNDMVIHYASLNHEMEDKTTYSYRLVGQNDNWLDWTTDTKQSFNNLWEGQYLFEVRAKNHSGIISNVASFHFEILSPWYRTMSSYVAFTGVIGLFMYLLIFIKTYQVKKDKKRLEQEVKLRTLEIQRQKSDLEEKNEELKALNDEKNNFISIVSHDLRTPLNQIKGTAVLLEHSETTFSDEDRTYFNIIKSSTDRLIDMIRRILNIDAIEKHELDVQLENFNITDTILKVIEELNTLAKEKSIKILFNPDNKTYTIRADKSLVFQITENIAANAIKFSPRNTTIDILLSQESEFIRLEIKDQGPGISKEDLDKMFAPYQKLSSKPTGNEDSSGLGLSIVKRYVDALDGKVWCSSELGQGATFHVEFKAG